MAEDTEDEVLKLLGRPGLERALQNQQAARQRQAGFTGLVGPGMLSADAVHPALQFTSYDQILADYGLRHGANEGASGMGFLRNLLPQDTTSFARSGPLQHRITDDEGMDYWVDVGGGGLERGELPPGVGEADKAASWERDRGTYQRLLAGELPPDWIPKSDYIPTIEQWLEMQGPGYAARGNNTPYYEYFKANFDLPVNRGDVFSGTPVVIGAALTGGALSGALPAAGLASGAGAVSPAVGAAISGSIQSAGQAAMVGGDVFEAALRGAATGAASAGTGNYVGAQIDNATLSFIANQATRAVTTAAASGGDLDQILQAGLTGAVTGATGAAISGDLWSMFDSPGMISPPIQPTSLSQPEMYAVSATGLPLSMPLPPSAIAEGYTGNLYNINPTTGLPYLMPVADVVSSLAADDTLEGEPPRELQAEEAPVEEVPVEEAPLPVEETTAVEQMRRDNLEQAAKYAKVAKQVYNLYNQITGGSGTVEGFELPRRAEGVTDEEYNALVGDSAVSYLGLDADAMREMGLVPGTPEYMAYIMEQADFLIEQAVGVNPGILLEGESADELKAALRNLSEKEMDQLARAMYVKGTLGAYTASSEVFDPFTGTAEQLGLLPGEFVAGDIAGAQRGYARSLERLARLPSAEFRSDLRGLLGRNIDLFGLQAQADEKAERRALQARDEIVRRGDTRQRVVPDASFWQDTVPLEEYLMNLLEGVV